MFLQRKCNYLEAISQWKVSAGKCKTTRNTLRQKSKVGVKHSVYQGGQNQCPSHCAKNGISLWAAAAAGLTGLTESGWCEAGNFWLAGLCGYS